VSREVVACAHPRARAALPAFARPRRSPAAVRTPVYSTWARVFGAKLDEAAHDVAEYPSLQAFFTRAVKHGVHEVDDRPGVLVSPADGRVVSLCSMDATHGVLQQVKGIPYFVDDFLGFHPRPTRPGNRLFSAVVYLSPGDYHRYHSPTAWTVHSRTHFAGQLLPVNGLAVSLVPSLFAANERVCCFGEWGHGFFSYTWGSRRSHVALKTYASPVRLGRGEEVGMFKLGSTIVLVFEAPEGLEWAVSPGDKVRVGQALCEPLEEGDGEGKGEGKGAAAAWGVERKAVRPWTTAPEAGYTTASTSAAGAGEGVAGEDEGEGEGEGEGWRVARARGAAEAVRASQSDTDGGLLSPGLSTAEETADSDATPRWRRGWARGVGAVE
jgi:phosphatidylserine decarboxylase